MTQKEIDRLRIGDIVLRHDARGKVNERVVRNVRRVFVTRGCPAGGHYRTSYSFVKLARSRWPSAYTILYPRELLNRRYVATGKRMRLTSRMDQKIARAIAIGGGKGAEIVSQDQVVGVVR